MGDWQGSSPPPMPAGCTATICGSCFQRAAARMWHSCDGGDMRGRISGWMRRSAVMMLIGVWSFSLLAQGLPMQSKQVMQRKLDASQQLLAALVTSDWVALDRRSRALKAQTADPGWDQMRLPEFQKHTAAFVQVTDALIE